MLGGEELALLHVESTVREHLPLMLHRDVRMPRVQEARERLEAGAAQGLAVGADLSGGGEFDHARHGSLSGLFKGSVPFFFSKVR